MVIQDNSEDDTAIPVKEFIIKVFAGWKNSGSLARGSTRKRPAHPLRPNGMWVNRLSVRSFRCCAASNVGPVRLEAVAELNRLRG